MMKKYTSHPRHLLLLSTVLMLFMACNGCKNDPKTTATSTPITGNNVYVRLGTEPNSLNLLTTEDASSIQVGNQIFQSLLEFDPKTLELTPVLAKSRPTIVHVDTGSCKGGASYTYEIREEATWSDGAPVTSADVVFTIKAILNKKSGAGNYRSSIDFIKNITIDAANPKKFTVWTDKRYILAEANVGTVPIFSE